MLLDEPLGALDLKLRRQMQIELKRIQTEVGITFVHVTHDQEEAMTMADTVAVMNAGRVEQLGAPVDLYESPRTTFVANFLGQSNLVTGVKAGPGSNGDLVVDCHGQHVTVRGSRCMANETEVPGRVRRRRSTCSRTARCRPAAHPHRVVSDASFSGVSTHLVTMLWAQDPRSSCRTWGRRPFGGLGGDAVLGAGPTFGLAGDAEAGTDIDDAPQGCRRRELTGGSVAVLLVVAHTGKPHRAPQPVARSRRRTPYLLLLPGMLWLALFFAVPIVTLFGTSLNTPVPGGDIGQFQQTFRFANYVDAIEAYYPQFIRSFVYAGLATLIALLIAYPLAYMIAFKSGRLRNLLLVLVVAPFFTSFILRTIAWRQILADEGWPVKTLKFLHLLPADATLNASAVAVVAGITYNFLPFMTLPLYASLERIDPRLIEAGGDLYANGLTVLQGHDPAVDARHRRRDPADVHPRGGRLRQRGVARHQPHPDGRQRDREPVLPGGRLPDGGVAVVHPDGRDPDPGYPLHPPCRDGGAGVSTATGEVSSGTRVSGRGTTSQPISRRVRSWFGRNWLRIYAVLAFGYLFLPIVYVTVFSFNIPAGNHPARVHARTGPTCGAPDVQRGGRKQPGRSASPQRSRNDSGDDGVFALARHRFHGRA